MEGYLYAEYRNPEGFHVSHKSPEVGHRSFILGEVEVTGGDAKHDKWFRGTSLESPALPRVVKPGRLNLDTGMSGAQIVLPYFVCEINATSEMD